MPIYETPGVYWEEREAAPPSVDAARMDVAGLVGIARKGPLDTPLPVESLRQFEAHFGGFTGAGYLAYAVKGFFDNGGQRAWIVRVAARAGAGAATAATLDLRVPAIPGLPEGAPGWRIAAVSPGSWGNALEIELRPGARVATTSLPAGTTALSLRVGRTAGFVRDGLIRVAQPGGPAMLRVLSAIDPAAGLLHLVHPEPARRRPSDLPLAGLDLTVPLLIESLSATVIVREGGRLAGIAADLSFVPDHPRYGPTVLATPDYAAVLRRQLPLAAPFPIVIEALADPAAAAPPLVPPDPGALPLTGGADGLAALSLEDFIGRPFAPESRGLQALERVPEPAALAIPDILIRPLPDPVIELPPRQPPDPCQPCPADAPTAALRPRPPSELPPVFGDDAIFQVQQALVEHCEARRDRMALLDPPFTAIAGPSLGIAPGQAWRSRFDSRHAALYLPWLVVVDPLRPGEVRAVPACGHVAGQYALAERLEGVHRAPANRDLAWAQAVTLPVRAAEHGLLNTQGINVIGPALGRGLRILGARTVSSDPVARFVPVRRVVMLLLRSFERATQWAVFEPNDHATRTSLTLGTVNFLTRLWQAGALAGDSAEAAFAVRCDESNNPPAERANGRLVCEIAVAPVDPLEFIVVRIGRVGGELEVEERSLRLGGELAA